MKLIVKDRYSVSVDDYRRKTVVSNNINFTQPLASSYPPANTPLSDDDKLLVRQGDDWKEVNKNEVGGGDSTPHISVDDLPANLLPNTIYFVKNTGKIVQTDASGVPVEYGKQLLKFEWNGIVYSQADKKQWAMFTYNRPRNSEYMSLYSPTNDVMNNSYRVPFIPVQPFMLKLKYIVFDAGMRQYPRPYDISISAMKAVYTNVGSTKQHILLQDVTTKGGTGSVDANRDVFIFESSDFIIDTINSGEFVTVGIAIDNTNDSSNRSLYFANLAMYAEII